MGNGTYTKYGYDLAGDLTSIVNYAPDNSVISSYVYEYDDLGRPISVSCEEYAFLAPGGVLSERDNRPG
jgi:hypothetical protein